MKKTKILLFAFMLLNLVMAPLVFAAPPPTEVLEFKEKSPLHVIGQVEEDVLLIDETEERGYSSQIRTMQLRIDKIIKKPPNLGRKSGESLNIVYSYVPSWVPMEGGAKMDIVVGDQIEIWLELGDKGWEPSYGGETVNHVKYIEPRKEPIPEPIHKRVKRNIEGNLELVIFGGLVFILLLMVVLQKFFRKN
ncbi:hypothetical protein [Pseudoneobacillus rhizosphaerae]|uniref:Uncharacterized protein n=1 Tax=Pseudoneobacillus rhizosphaerae TaxID=2880968 RepID=A0A9C7GE28_9BACI|nr:hypothetical protein [Pseudoneobacillus rhizosphaerae]CAG9610729.1 hypothetical protein NEOCIP111885_04505 [Pseudoneobacillus rhizosphaerae]